MNSYTIAQIDAAIEAYITKVKDHEPKIETGAGEAADLTATLIRNNQIDQMGASMKALIAAHLETSPNNNGSQSKEAPDVS
jgi:hypothetical protein